MGKRVFLVRHAKALKRDEWEGDDCKRPLTEEGEREFKEFLKVLEPFLPKEGKVISSPCERALKTAELLADFLSLPLVVDERLSPDAEPEDYLSVIKRRRGVLYLVGHEPDLSLFLNRLTCLSPSGVAFKKGAVAELRKREDRWQLYAFYNPKSLNRTRKRS
jgi:phosphohistidine phosphatase